MILKVRDEADIMEDNLRYHRAQGVDFFVVADTGSTDGTVEMLERYERAGVLTLVRMPGGIRAAREGAGETRITRLAVEMGADWVIHNDADEFWWPIAGDLKDALDSIPARYGMVVAPRTEFVPRPDRDGPFAERLTLRERHFRRPPKTAHRAHPGVVTRGAHPIELWVDTGSSPRGALVGKPIRRERAKHTEPELPLIPAPTFPLAVLHFPFRSLEHYSRRVEIAIENRQLSRGRVKEAYDAGRLEDVYADLVIDEEAAARAIADGWLVEDNRLRDYLRECPDLLDGGSPPSRSPTNAPEPSEREVIELQFDGMHAIGRYLQAQAHSAEARREELARRRRTERDLRRKLRRLRRRARQLRRIEASLWWRLRPRLPRRRRS
jgi:Glycosyl transferase family 2